jgi:hypothetical protein
MGSVRIATATLAAVVILICTPSAGARSNQRPSPPAISAAWRHRRLHLPSMESGTCPVSTRYSQPSRDVGFMLGTGPARPVGFRSDGTLDYVAPADSNVWPIGSTVWGGNKTLWAVAPRVTSDVLVRGRQLDRRDTVRFGMATGPDAELVLPAPEDHGHYKVVPGRTPAAGDRIAGGWRAFPSETRLLHPGCYGYQIDTPSTSTVIVFKAVPSVAAPA